MRIPTRLVGPLVLVTALVGAGCDYERGSTVANPLLPSLVSAGGTSTKLGGTWASSSAGLPIAPDSCGDFQWQMTSLTSTGVSGSFSATCAGGIRVAGTGNGTLRGQALAWEARGNATSQSGPSCSFELAGTATPETADAIRVNYTGTVCGVSVRGSEVWRRR